MSLSSGDVIKCNQHTLLCIAIKKLMRIKGIHFTTTHYMVEKANDLSDVCCSDCSGVLNLFRFIEENYEILRTHPDLPALYNYILQNINYTISNIENGKNYTDSNIENGKIKCGCWHYFSYRITEGVCMLTPEYEYHEKQYASISDKEKQELSSSLANRKAYRLYRKNFMVATEILDSDDVQVKEHDYNLILDELRFWQTYFQQEHNTTIAEARKVLSTFIQMDDDCVSKILEFI